MRRVLVLVSLALIVSGSAGAAPLAGFRALRSNDQIASLQPALSRAGPTSGVAGPRTLRRARRGGACEA